MQDLEGYTIVAKERLRGDTVISLRFDFLQRCNCHAAKGCIIDRRQVTSSESRGARMCDLRRAAGPREPLLRGSYLHQKPISMVR